MEDEIKLRIFSILGLIIAVSMALACGGGAGGGGGPTTVESTGANIVNVHTNASSYDSSECIRCHGNMESQTTLDSKVEGVHPKHIRLTSLICTDCHKSVDLLQDSGANLRRQVDVQKCVNCHGTTFFQGAS